MSEGENGELSKVDVLVIMGRDGGGDSEWDTGWRCFEDCQVRPMGLSPGEGA